MVRLLTEKVPNKSDGWGYFFSSLEKAFPSENVSNELKPKVLLCMLRDKVSNLLVNLGEEELKDYESLKQFVLKEYEPSPQKYVQKILERPNVTLTKLSLSSRPV
ncbi:hypothetical protein TNCV_1983301 [Trichonephila clavipes]|nr:hypothetical protein TNCV_1983301 [Trichonephila clavipes]